MMLYLMSYLMCYLKLVRLDLSFDFGLLYPYRLMRPCLQA